MKDKDQKEIIDEEESMRSEEEIKQAIDEYREKIWYDRYQIAAKEAEKSGDTIKNPELWKTALEAAMKLERKYGDNLGPYDDFSWGMLCGQLSALNWVIG